jgi:flagellar biogenesis protein FliO
MKNSIFYTLAFVLVATLTFAQAHRDAVPGEEGIDTISLVVGLVVGQRESRGIGGLRYLSPLFWAHAAG